ncbi:nitroreductase/quinone reductase family protein [Serinicoccus sp. CNJ-927]|uniref:nitroreductase/quinone reductase family protein n=1 Tax=Serinicoccus sp. CNJ-927 TaxID=1904970 RepID=UPI001EDB6A53|nr:nitroreductase/quinone reductase family protein [Serinicoccus sp. CNJ-927]
MRATRDRREHWVPGRSWPGHGRQQRTARPGRRRHRRPGGIHAGEERLGGHPAARHRRRGRHRRRDDPGPTGRGHHHAWRPQRHAQAGPADAGRARGSYLAVASKGGAPEHPAWYYNVAKNPDVLVQDGTSQQALRARELAEGPERDAWWERAAQTFPSYADYQEKTDRLIPLFVLEPLRG